MSKKQSRSITLTEKDLELIDEKAINLSKWVRNQLRSEFPDHYE
jgi:hypothetical protein